MVKISGLPADTAPTGTDVVATVDTETSTTKKVLLSDIIALIGTSLTPAGILVPYGGKTAPSASWLLCDGSAISRTTYATLWAAISPSVGTCTITNATPAVVTLTSHGLQTGDQVYLTTTSALPTGLSVNTLYYAVRIDANTFSLSTSRANAYAGTKIATSGAGSGVHTLYDCAWGLGDGSTTFYIPDFRGRVPAGNDSIGGTVASRLSLAQTQGVYGNRGASGGEQGHQITTAELAAHAHTYNVSGVGGVTIPLANGGATGASPSTNSAGSDTAHNNVQPSLVTNYIIKT